MRRELRALAEARTRIFVSIEIRITRVITSASHFLRCMVPSQSGPASLNMLEPELEPT